MPGKIIIELSDFEAQQICKQAFIDLRNMPLEDLTKFEKNLLNKFMDKSLDEDEQKLKYKITQKHRK